MQLGHAGYGAALAASHQFHHILHERLVDIIDLLMDLPVDRKNLIDHIPHPISFHRDISKDELSTKRLFISIIFISL